MIAIVAGTTLLRSMLFENWDETTVETPYGRASVRKASQYLFLQRHGKKAVPPHMINHRANIWALKSLGAGMVPVSTNVLPARGFSSSSVIEKSGFSSLTPRDLKDSKVSIFPSS